MSGQRQLSSSAIFHSSPLSLFCTVYFIHVEQNEWRTTDLTTYQPDYLTTYIYTFNTTSYQEDEQVVCCKRTSCSSFLLAFSFSSLLLLIKGLEGYYFNRFLSFCSTLYACFQSQSYFSNLPAASSSSTTFLHSFDMSRAPYDVESTVEKYILIK